VCLLLFIVGYLYVLGTPISKNADPIPHTHALGGLSPADGYHMFKVAQELVRRTFGYYLNDIRSREI